MQLRLENVSFRYSEKAPFILKNVNMTVNSGERLGLSAPSGHGKTTLCKLMAGYLKPTQGEIYLDDRPLSACRGYCPVQLIWQHPELSVNPKMRMREVLMEGDELEPGLLEELGIQRGWLDRFPSELSGGELQRFCIARAMGKRTRFILADETTAMLDLINQNQIWQVLLKETARREIGLVAVSHNERLLEKFSDFILNTCHFT